MAMLGLCFLSACQSGETLSQQLLTGRQATQATPPTVTNTSPPNYAAAAPTATHTATPISTATANSGAQTAALDAAATSDPTARPLNPLTGLPATDPRLLERRPLAIKISNYPRDIRPQFGLNEADVVFEYYIEWGYTRFIGIFYGENAAKIGPVRSGRYFDEHITRMYRAFYVFNFADPREYGYFLGGDLAASMVVPGGNCSISPFFTSRISTRIADAAHYECYFDATRFGDHPAHRAAVDSAPDLRSTFFSAAPLTEGATVERLSTYFSRCDYSYWQYDADSGRYLRFQEVYPSKDLGRINDCLDNPRTYSALVDSVTGEQVFADNVIVIFASHTFANANEESDEIYHIDLVDSGRAYVFRDGMGTAARWVRTDVDQPLLITTLAGDPFGLRPGRTFFEVLGETSKEWSDGTEWHFDFHTP